MTTFDYTSNPTAPTMSADEFTSFLAQEKLERTLTNIARRAENLWNDGYTMKAEDGFYFVYSPKNKVYIIFTGDNRTGEHCSCPSWKEYGTCKHYLGLTWKLREEGECAAHDAKEEQGEGEFGTDPHAEY